MVVRKKVTWKVDRRLEPRQKPPRNYAQDVALTPDHAAELDGKLVPGELFVLTTALEVQDSHGYIPPPHPYLIAAWYPDRAVVHVGSLAIYAGLVRVEELKGSTILRAPRHSFIINGCRYLLTNLHHISPAPVSTQD